MTLRKIGYAICTNCGCNESEIEIYQCESCGKRCCSKCAQDVVGCPDSDCGTNNLKQKGYIQPFDELEDSRFV
ncbi:hypothetical protein M3184_02600 [Metabacillus litoralis]|jgi:hypothetical protein|uniref:B box-type domain-containing protein n=1 Tax=Metabacillus rhizolycopersici TaxID=2875709 RepID=A0ABS7UUR4_9BACI|nr:hypothetical protein [Metabacillus rhizolycopersici]MBZ5752023.1 hypothetical protein [Metabacillus rhizolycopersici]MCM3650797.1 hypothetical protein [Metabacillus litoralis]